MGRAFPELQMDTFCIYGVPPTPSAISDIRGHIAVFDHIDDARDLERYARQVTVQMGEGPGPPGPQMSGAEAKRTAIPGTLTFAVLLGEAVLAARQEHGAPSRPCSTRRAGEFLFTGKIDVDRQFVAGFARGHLTLDGTGDRQRPRVLIDFQNENLVATDETARRSCAAFPT